jgi:membrane-bound serine protease (ClpP class)
MFGLTACSGQNASPGSIDVIQIDGVIDPTTATYLLDKLRQAEDDGVQAAVIEIDTPGGLDAPTDEIVQQIVDSDVPIVSWVAPNGARAASTATFVVYASDLAFMADPSELGPAYPVNLAMPVPDPPDRGAMDDTEALLRELATAQGRAPDGVEQVVGDPTDAKAAAEAGMIDGTASSLADLLEQVDGAEVRVAGGSDVVIETWNEDEDVLSTSLRFQNPTLLQQLLHLVTDPEVAFFLLLVGLFGLIFEVYNPGIGLAGLLGALSLLLGLYALSILPTDWTGVFLVVLGVAFFVVDLQIAGLGTWTAGGLVSLIAGSVLLFGDVDGSLSLDAWAIAAGVALALLFFISIMTAALRVRLRRPISGEEAIVGALGEAKTDIAPEGTVMSKGTLWRARTMETGIAAGARVRVMATEGLVLLVEPDHHGSGSPDEADPGDP